jgi:hypothetical protein
MTPKTPNSLFDLGMIKWQGKRDGKGALAGLAGIVEDPIRN